ncbi:hypothetical protein AAG747_13110 [Rapidithrix thailandica]|uniref:Peptidoglycan binding-like domain-containing protein n=1 Tax=Rapidithrix thailandica TaxID=413964 RepID=A0AAW9S924_9BACT
MQSLFGLEAYLPEGQLEVLDQGRESEAKQALIELGYLSPNLNSSQQTFTDDLLDGIRQFRKDYLRARLIPTGFRTEIREIQRIEGPGQFSEFELQLLLRLTDLEGSFQLPTQYNIGDQSLFTRVLHYRLDVLGLYTQAIGQAFNSETQKAISQLKQWLKLTHPQQVFQLLGDVPKLTQYILSQPEYKDRIVYFRHHNPRHQKLFSFEHAPEFRREFRRRLKQQLDRQSTTFKDFKKFAFRNEKKMDFDFLQEQVEQDSNRLLLRLLQVHQWMRGHYRGLLDNEMGDVTFESLLEFHRTEVEAGNVDLQAGHFMMHLAQGYWVLNIHYLFEDILSPEFFEKFDTEDFYHQFNSLMENHSVQAKHNIQRNMNEVWQAVNDEARQELSSKKNLIRRIYQGAKSLFRTLGRMIKNVFRWLAQKVKQTLNILKNMVKVLFREIREAIRMFGRGLGFLFGKRMVYTPHPNGNQGVITDFDFDFDATLIVPEHSSPHLLRKHVENCQSYVKAMEFSMLFTAKVIKWVITSSSPIGWTRFAFHLVKVFKNFIFGELLRTRKPFWI